MDLVQADPVLPANGSFAAAPHYYYYSSSSYSYPTTATANISTTAAAAAAAATSNNVLSEGGLPWYLAGFELRGTSAVEERWTTGREALRSLSEELTDMDEEALRDLEFDVDEENTITIAGGGGGNG